MAVLFYLYREAKRLIELNNRLKEDYETVSAKYAEIIGHQNPKQRIKHVTQLKNKIYQLEQVRWLTVLLLAIFAYIWYPFLMELLPWY